MGKPPPKWRCIECGEAVKNLYQEYSPGNIKLTHCEACHAYADEYVEHEKMVVFIDLILHKERAYRHLLFNVLPQQRQRLKEFLWNSTVAVLLLNTGKKWLRDHQSNIIFDGPLWPTVSSFLQYSLAEVFMGSLLYLGMIIGFVRYCYPSQKRRWTDVILAVNLSSFFKLLALPMLVWKFEQEMVLVIDLFVLTSNVTALKVLLETSFSHAGALVAASCLLRWTIVLVQQVTAQEILSNLIKEGRLIHQ